METAWCHKDAAMAGCVEGTQLASVSVFLRLVHMMLQAEVHVTTAVLPVSVPSPFQVRIQGWE